MGVLPTAAIAPQQSSRDFHIALLSDAEGTLGGRAVRGSWFVDQHVHPRICKRLDSRGQSDIRQGHQGNLWLIAGDQGIELGHEWRVEMTVVQARTEMRIEEAWRTSSPQRFVGLVDRHDLDLIWEKLETFDPARRVVMIEPDDRDPPFRHLSRPN